MKYASRRATLLINPVARGAGKFDVPAALARLREAGVTPRLSIGRDAGHTRELAERSAADEDDLLLVVGGDGTARAVTGALAKTKTALATLRGGTANVWAREAGIPAGMAGIDAHLSGQVVEVDLGYCGDEPFLLMASAGWDAEVVARVGARAKRWLGPASYVGEAVRALPGLRTAHVEMTIDGEPAEAEAALVLMGNTRLYGAVVHLTPDAVATDGLLDVMIAEPGSLAGVATTAARLAIPRLGTSDAIRRTRARKVAIATAGLRIQLDGDACGKTPATFTVSKRALKVSVPAGPLPDVLRG